MVQKVLQKLLSSTLHCKYEQSDYSGNALNTVNCSSPALLAAPQCQKYSRLGLGFLKDKVSFPSNFSLTRETDTQKSWKLTKTLILPNWQMFFVYFTSVSVTINFIIQKESFWKISSLFLYQFLSWEKIEGIRGFVLQRIEATVKSCTFSS